MATAKKDKKEIFEIKLPMSTSEFMSDFNINLDLPGIYFVEGWSQYENGCSHYKKLMKAIKKHDDLAKSFQAIKEKKSIKTENKFAKISWSLRELEILYEPVIKHFTLSIILLAGTVEAYINELAEILLPARPNDEFDKLSLFGKWIFLPKVCGIKVKWDVGSEPLQSLSKLVSIRNKLMHFKGRRQRLNTYLTPRFIEEMDLIPDAVKRSFQGVQTLIKEFSLAWRGGFGPDWLYIDSREIRNPCFYLNNREASMVLHSGRIDKEK